jgi:hypothetical protein
MRARIGCAIDLRKSVYFLKLSGTLFAKTSIKREVCGSQEKRTKKGRVPIFSFSLNR